MESEVGALRRVLLHRPGLELKRLTPYNKDELLFDEVPWVARARQEHDVFADALSERGVEVLYLQDLLARTLASEHARAELLGESLCGVAIGSRLAAPLREWLGSLPAADLACWLIGGISYADLPFQVDALLARAAAPEQFVLPPLPNQLFHPRLLCLALRRRGAGRLGQACTPP